MFVIKIYKKSNDNSNAVQAIDDKRLMNRMNEFRLTNFKNKKYCKYITLYN